MKKQIEEMNTMLNDYFDNTPMELSFEHENGDTDIITDEKILDVIDAITRQALIPLFCEVIYNAGYRKQEWISVEERLPRESEVVLAYSVKFGVIQRIYTSYKGDVRWWSNECWSSTKQLEITHWMPLPEAPKMKGGAE